MTKNREKLIYYQCILIYYSVLSAFIFPGPLSLSMYVLNSIAVIIGHMRKSKFNAEFITFKPPVLIFGSADHFQLPLKSVGPANAQALRSQAQEI